MLEYLQITHYRKKLHIILCELHVITSLMIIMKIVMHANCKLLLTDKPNILACNAVLVMPQVHRAHM